MSRKKNSHRRRNPWSRKHRVEHDYQNLEPRFLLANVIGDLAVGQPIADAFADNAVTPKQMVERASVMPYAKGELVVALRTSKFNSARLSEQVNWSRYLGVEDAQPMRQLMSVSVNDRQNVTLVHLDVGDADIFELMRQLDQNPEVMWSAPNFQLEGDMREFVPNDPDYPSQYHHTLMQNDDAWDITLGSPDIIIGVTDDGVELFHSDLNANIWQNIDDFPFDGIDNDGNGYVDDFNGWDFSSGDNDPNPNSSADTHGTHVAGIAAGRTNNSVGISGTSGGSTIMPLQFYGVGAWTAAVINETFAYAADNGANIVNTSYNIDGWVGDPVFTAGLQYLYDNDVLHFNSAGNAGAEDPARQAFEQTLLVASTESDDTRSGFSNYGSGIDVAAPGGSILSTVTGNGYDTLSGTSMAAPNAAGAAALIWSAHPTWTRDQVAAQLAGTADNIDSLNPGFEGKLGYGRVNSYSGITATLGAPAVDEVVGLPADGTYLDDTTIDQFSVSFTQIMDPASVNDSANIDLRAAGPDDVFGTGDDVVVNLSYDPYMIGTNDLVITMPDGPMNYGHYQLTLNSGGLQNPFLTPLDGDGDGTGGDSYLQEFWISPPLAGTVSFNRGTYLLNDTVEIKVGDANAVNPVSVVVTTTGGDSETLTLTDLGSGLFLSTINTVEGAAVPGDGQLNVSLGEDLTVTYEDADDGTGNPATVSDTATINNVIRWDSSDTPIPITSNNTITSVINIPDTGKINDLDLELDITHTYDADLDVFLIAPDGTRIELFQDIGGSGDDFTNTYLDDEAATSIADGSAPFTGSFRPIGSFSVLDNTSMTGDWTLEVTDDAGGDEGTLNWWSVIIDVRSFDEGTVSMDQESYNVGDTINIEVVDSNAVAPVDVSIVSTSGDTEVLTLTDMGSGVFSGSIATVSGTPTGDGQLQVELDDIVTVTYEDMDTGSGGSNTVTDTANIQNVIEYPSSDVPIDIVSNTTITSDIVITDEGFVNDVDVLLDITHTWDSDLDVFLIAPDGTRIELFTDVGGSGDNFTQTRLDDEASSPITGGSAPFTGSFQPEGVLGNADGLSITGTWTLEITDDAGGDEGTLNAWSLFIDVLPPPPTPDIAVIGPATAVDEGDSGTTSVDFEIQLSEPTTQVVTVDYATTVAGFANPAYPGGDFIEDAGTVTFQPGETSKIVSIDVVGDYLIELDEQFGLELTNPTGGVIVTGIASATIDDTDRFLQAKPLDFVTNDSPIAADTRGLTDLEYTPGKKIGWAAGAVGLQFVDRATHSDDFQRDLMLAEDATLNIDITGSARYRITVTYGDADVARDDMQLTVEGRVKPLVSTAAGEFITRTYMVTMNDGQMNLQFTDMGGTDNLVAIAGVQVQRVTRPPFGGGGGG